MQTVDMTPYLDNPDSPEALVECKKVAQLFREFGALAVKDPRVTEEESQKFLDMVENYFEQPENVILEDARPDLHFQVGVTPEGVETPLCIHDPKCNALMEKLEQEHKPHKPSGADVKWRYFHNLGKRPQETKFPTLNADPVYPKAFPNWGDAMENWGVKLLTAGKTLAEMAALGYGLPKDTFTKLMEYGPHLLAPTASNLGKYQEKGTILAGFHQDLNFITVHGKSRFPGLFIWLRNGQKIPVSVPNGCLLAQAGMQFEHLTGGEVIAGYHEVVITDKTIEAIEKAKKEGRPLWRISSTVFTHIGSDELLKPYLNSENESQYKPVLAGDQVREVLTSIKLKVQ